VIPRDGKLLVAINGAYGRRMAKIASIHEIATAAVEFPETQPVDPQRVAHLLAADRAITHVGVVDCETRNVESHRRRIVPNPAESGA
jgi:2-aminoethylphosphonate-pyruvate transaminase